MLFSLRFGMLCTFLVVANILLFLSKLSGSSISNRESRISIRLRLRCLAMYVYLLVAYRPFICARQSVWKRPQSEIRKLQITLFLWFFSMKTHVAISIDRFLNIVYPSYDENRARTKTYGFFIIFLKKFLFMTAAIQTSLLHLCKFGYNILLKKLFSSKIPEHSSHMTLKIIDSWNYHGSEWAETYAMYVSRVILPFSNLENHNWFRIERYYK